MKRIIGFFLVLPSILLFISSAFGAGQCVLPTTPGSVIFPPNWHGKPYLFTSSETVNQGESVDTWVVSTWPYPPYYWSLSGEEFYLEKAKTNSDFEINKLSAGSYSCGAAAITVTDSIGQTDTGYVRGVGVWRNKGQWREHEAYCSEGETRKTVPTRTIIIGYQKWKFPGTRHYICGTKGRCRKWIVDGGSPEYPPCGNPYECVETSTCPEGYYPFYDQSIYFEWGCP